MKLSKAEAYRIYTAGNSLWSLTILHEGNEELIERDLKVIYDNLKGVKVPASAMTLQYMQSHIERSKWLSNLL